MNRAHKGRRPAGTGRQGGKRVQRAKPHFTPCAGIGKDALRGLFEPAIGGARPCALIAWATDDKDTRRRLAEGLTAPVTREFIAGIGSAGCAYAVVWGSLWNPKAGALHLGVRDAAGLVAAMQLVCEYAEEKGATSTTALLALPGELRNQCLAVLGEMAETRGTA